jgi:NAD(P)-dependent dehydrogenase (short-subunit alcohol dehydrogenase family)
MDFTNLDDRGVLVTGGAGGIGLALGRLFREAGARVFLVDRDA